MKVLDVVQGSPEWLRVRLGIPTASAYDRILTPKTLKPSAERFGYASQLLSEWFLGHEIDWGGASKFMERGTDMEPEARSFYELERDVSAQVVGFVMRDDGMTGGSPDSLVGDDGGLEIKCPAINTAIAYFLDPASLATKYRHQVQGYLYLTRRAWWDIISYHPDVPPVIVRVARDEEYIAALDFALDAFLRELVAARAMLEPHKAVRDASVAAVQRELVEQDRAV